MKDITAQLDILFYFMQYVCKTHVMYLYFVTNLYINMFLG